MKIAMYHPQLNNFGGGETVCLTIAEALSAENEVDIYTPFEIDIKELEKFFNLDLNNVKIKVFGKYINIIPGLSTIKPYFYLHSIYKKLEEYDVVIDTATNGWFDRKLKTKTMCYIHFPFFYTKKKGIKSILNKFIIGPNNSFQYDKIFCNSNFTKKIVSKLTNKPIEVLYPPVEVAKITPAKKKQKRIVTIGRFTYDKKHEVMIDAFIKLRKKTNDYSFHIIGSFQENNSFYKKDYLDMLRNKAKGYPIEFHINMPHNEVLQFLEESSIYWHARGYGETDPNEYENFGITTVEAMAAGCIPIVINLGGQPEIVEHGKNGFLWNCPIELILYTMSTEKNNSEIVQNSIKSAKKYNSSKFNDKMLTLINSF